MPRWPPPGAQAASPPPAGQAALTTTLVWILVLALASVIAVALGLSLKEDDVNGWESVHAWGGLALVGSILTAAPALGSALGERTAWRIAVGGAGALGLFWVLLVLPQVGSNLSLLTTCGVAAGITAACLAPGRPGDPSAPAGPQGHQW